ncbi:unnamed protein product [Vicia faba]|uniref:P-type phospholipid transporter n=1 Tax=Vicia faba TaxID=3906 RepID=A0AAV0ZVW1_VICFA|nr:unnamed protein product [Vicia faba]
MPWKKLQVEDIIKVMMNSMNVPSKRSTLERKLDKLILALFATLFMMCFIGAIGSAIFVNKKYFYLHLDSSEEGSAQFNPKNRFLVFILTMFTLITLYSTIIPISLYVSIEMIKFIQSTQFINKDLGMYHNETNTPALARTSNLNEELGQVEYIFSDKTGTLTRNLMEFFKCSIGVEVYGNGVTEIERGLAERNGMKIEENRLPHTVHEKGFNFEDARLMRGAWRNEPNPDACRQCINEDVEKDDINDEIQEDDINDKIQEDDLNDKIQEDDVDDEFQEDDIDLDDEFQEEDIDGEFQEDGVDEEFMEDDISNEFQEDDLDALLLEDKLE